MRTFRDRSIGKRLPPPAARHSAALARSQRQRTAPGKRARGGQRNVELPFSPPEDWYESPEVIRPRNPYGFRIVVQPPGDGYQHVLTPAEVRSRLRQLPPQFVSSLEVVQLSRMTRKKERFPCYGMQWGSSLYLYPLEEERVEYQSSPPKPSQLTEAQMFGGRWVQTSRDEWQLIWTEPALKDFYLNNILIHELGHLVDDRNNSHIDRERYAEWFALEYGYKQSLRLDPRVRQRPVLRQHG